jgi:ribulose 1,5-bisphosphate synthetase/thiazole synthase
LLALATVSGSFAALDSAFFHLFETIERDVVIIGGGAAGSHAAVRLREDYKKSVVVIEKDDILVRR